MLAEAIQCWRNTRKSLYRKVLLASMLVSQQARHDIQCEPFLFESSFVRLSDLPKGAAAVVVQVDDAHADDPIAQRLRDLGFVQGEPVRLVARGPLGADPLLVQIGSTRFALRRSEAARVSVQVETV
jgi:ferrous iron transport protein A